MVWIIHFSLEDKTWIKVNRCVCGAVCLSGQESGVPAGITGHILMCSTASLHRKRLYQKMLLCFLASALPLMQGSCCCEGKKNKKKTCEMKQNTRTQNDSAAVPKRECRLRGLQLYPDSLLGWWIILSDVTHPALRSCCVSGTTKNTLKRKSLVFLLTLLVARQSNSEPTWTNFYSKSFSFFVLVGLQTMKVWAHLFCLCI